MLNEEVSVERVRTDAALQEAYRIRYQVYCQDRGFLRGRDGIETDAYDGHANHAIIRWRHSGAAIGTVRLVLSTGSPGDDFPVEHACDPSLMRRLPRARIGEVSRFALPKRQTAEMRAVSPTSASLLRLALLQGALSLSAEAGHTHWLAVMQPTLLRLLRGDGLHFEPLGPMITYHGRRQPVVANLATMMAGVARKQPAIWHYLTRGGTLVPAWPLRGVSLPAAVLAERSGNQVGLCLRLPMAA
jgi:N-acyl amino acid synthase of PEP-CTERM/exosortase system